MIPIDITEPNEIVTPQLAELAVGIDLGTTNSLLAYSIDQNASIIGDIFPSVLEYEGVILSSVKRFMGKNINDYDHNSNLAKYVKPSSEGVRFDLGPQSVSPVEFSAEILRRLKLRAEHYFNQPVKKVVITVPAYFDEQARADTKKAATIAGLEVLRLLNEPTAAALAYGVDKQSEGVYLVYDFGGGTFDVSVLKMQRGVFHVLATGGDANLGGDDVDYLLANELVKISGKFDYLAARRIKEVLSVQQKMENITREQFEELVSPIIEKTIKIAMKVVRDAQIDIDQLSGVILVGGSTRIPLVKKRLEEVFGKKCLCSLDPDRVVALGAALQAESLTKGSSNLLIDVTPLSLGLEVMGGLNEIIIHRNSTIPVAIAKEFTTYQDGQTAMQFHIVQGERDLIADCRSLAKFELRNIPPMKAGVAKVRVVFNVDADGLLVVSAEELTTGSKQMVEVRPTYGLDQQQIEQMLLASFDNAEQDINNRLLQESIIKAQQLIVLIEDAFKDDPDLTVEEEVVKVALQKEKIKAAIDSSARDQIDAEAEALEAIIQNFADRKINKYLRKALVGKKVD